MPKTAIFDHEFIQRSLANYQLLEQSLNGNTSIPFHKLRKSAIERFSQLGIPTTKNEEWKYTNIQPAVAPHYALPLQPVTLLPDKLKSLQIEGLEHRMLVLVNGRFSPELSTLQLPDSGGLQIKSLRTALDSYPEVLNAHLSRYARFETESFVALNTALFQDGIFIHLSRGTCVEEPIHLCQLSTVESEALLTMPRILIVMEANTQAHFVETYQATGEMTYFTDAVTEVALGPDAILEYIKVQLESKTAYHVATTTVHQDHGSRFTSVNVDLGAAIARNNLSAILDGESSEAHLYGFFRATGRQLIDNHTLIDHAKPNCQSNELYKGILDDQARGVFNGKVMVRPNAQKTNAFQENKCLLLTNDAIMNAKPQLEIFADDVKCSHGATVGQLDEDALFYLRSRGIDEEKANSILRHAFANDVFERIEVIPVRQKLEALIFEHYND